MTDTRAHDRYVTAHNRMVHDNVPIPFPLLRRYLDWLLEARRGASGDMYAKRLVITGQWLRPTKFAREFFELAVMQGYVIDSEGQRWSRI